MQGRLDGLYTGIFAAAILGSLRNRSIVDSLLENVVFPARFVSSMLSHHYTDLVELTAVVSDQTVIKWL